MPLPRGCSYDGFGQRFAHRVALEWTRRDLNPRPPGYEPGAPPTKLQVRSKHPQEVGSLDCDGLITSRATLSHLSLTSSGMNIKACSDDRVRL